MSIDITDVWEGKEFFVCSMLQEEIKEHRRTLNPEAPRDFLDAFLIEMSSSSEDFTGKFPSELFTKETIQQNHAYLNRLSTSDGLPKTSKHPGLNYQ